MARMPGLGWTLSLALIGQGTCFHLVGSPLSRTDVRDVKANCNKPAILRTPGRVHPGRLRRVREGATAVSSDSSSESDPGKADVGDGNRHGKERGAKVEKVATERLMDYFIRCDTACTAVMMDHFCFFLPRLLSPRPLRPDRPTATSPVSCSTCTSCTPVVPYVLETNMYSNANAHTAESRVG